MRRVAVQVLTSLEALVRAGIVHCDIKPENIMLVDRKRSDVKVGAPGRPCRMDIHRRPATACPNRHDLLDDNVPFPNATPRLPCS